MKWWIRFELTCICLCSSGSCLCSTRKRKIRRSEFDFCFSPIDCVSFHIYSNKYLLCITLSCYSLRDESERNLHWKQPFLEGAGEGHVFLWPSDETYGILPPKWFLIHKTTTTATTTAANTTWKWKYIYQNPKTPSHCVITYTLFCWLFK